MKPILNLLLLSVLLYSSCVKEKEDITTEPVTEVIDITLSEKLNGTHSFNSGSYYYRSPNDSFEYIITPTTQPNELQYKITVLSAKTFRLETMLRHIPFSEELNVVNAVRSAHLNEVSVYLECEGVNDRDKTARIQYDYDYHTDAYTVTRVSYSWGPLPKTHIISFESPGIIYTTGNN